MSIRAANFNELRLDRVSRCFGDMHALKDVTLAIKKGEFIALLGPSGCGKSTTLNIIAGLLDATGGGIWLDDKRIDTLRPEQRGFGMVFQNYALFPHMSVRKNIGFGLAMRGVKKSEIRRRVEEAIAMARLQGQEEKLPGQLSGGQQQRVAIARAIVIEPPLVLMDEPLSNLDAKLRLEMRAEIRRIHNSLGATTIYVTHDQEEALSLADRIVVVRHGEVRQIGTPSELFSKPDSLDVAEFMGFRNRISGVLAAQNENRATVQIGTARVFGELRGKTGPGLRAIMAVRTDDLHPGVPTSDALPVTVTVSEFRGHCFACHGRTHDGIDVSFRSVEPQAPGKIVHLHADPEKVLVFPEAS